MVFDLVPNLYQKMSLARGASDVEIDGRFRILARKCHPDKNSSEEAKAQFLFISQARDMLKNAEVSKVYDRFGLESVNLLENKVAVHEVVHCVEFVYFSLLWIIVMIIFVRGRVVFWRSIRGFSLLLFIQALVVFGKQQIPVWLSPHYTSYDMLVFMYLLFPFYVFACSFSVESTLPPSAANIVVAAEDKASLVAPPPIAVSDNCRRSSRQQEQQAVQQQAKQQKEQQVKKQARPTMADMANSAALLRNETRPATRAQCAATGAVFSK